MSSTNPHKSGVASSDLEEKLDIDREVKRLVTMIVCCTKKTDPVFDDDAQEAEIDEAIKNFKADVDEVVQNFLFLHRLRYRVEMEGRMSGVVAAGIDEAMKNFKASVDEVLCSREMDMMSGGVDEQKMP